MHPRPGPVGPAGGRGLRPARPAFPGPSDLTQGLRDCVLAPFRPFAASAGLAWDAFSGPEWHWYEVRRGFVEAQTLLVLRQLEAWVPHAPALLARVPILRLGVNRSWGYSPHEQDPTHLPARLAGLLAVEGIECLHELSLYEFSLGPAAADVLLRHGPRPRLEALRVRYRTLSRQAVRALRERFGAAIDLTRAASDDDIPF